MIRPRQDGLRIQVSFSYSDGFGREIQKKIQAERGPLVANGPDVSPRWVGSGWTIFNNKGKPVRQYEPFFDDTHEFKFGHKVGVSPILLYDPVERVVATLHPNHTYEKVVFDPWQQKTWDVNDTVMFDPRTDPEIMGFVNAYFSTQPPTWETWYTARAGGDLGIEEQSAAQKTAAHADTPPRAYFDTLGRTFLTVADNGKDANGTPLLYCTRILLDIEGNQREVIDAKDRIVMRYDYDLLSNRIHQASMEAGERWMLNNVAGNPIRAWDSRYFARRMTYDVLQRPMGLYFTDAGKEKLAEFTIYGEAHPQAAALNLRGKVFLQLAGAGAVINYWKDLQTGQEEAYDFKGNLLHSTRRLAKEYQERKSWSDLESSLNDLTALENALNQLEGFSGSTEYDALNRPTAMTTPDKSVVRPQYNEANLLDKITANLRGSATVTGFVNNINYNEKGQRVFIEYGNGVTTEYSYDSETFRLKHLYTARPAADYPSDDPNPSNPSRGVQNLFYTYDPAGNITVIRDEA